MRKRLGRSSPPNQTTPVENLVDALREYLHLPDPGAVYVLLGAVAANLHDGPPVWVMLVGPPGSGGSEFLNLLLCITGIVEAGLIETSAAFLSGTSEKEITKESTGGLLRAVGTHGGIVLKDFTSIITLPIAERKKVMNVFRETYDGRWTRPVGSDGGRSLQWEGKCGFFAKCTGSIDHEIEVNASLGERWAYYRMGQGYGFERSRRALKNSAESADWRKDLQQRVKAFYMGLDLEFKRNAKRRNFKDYEHTRLIRLGDVASRCRSAVKRDTFHGDIVGVRETEMGTRITNAMGQLYIGMEAIGVREPERWKQLAKITFDSMPALRRMLIQAVHDGKDMNVLVGEIGSGKRAVKQAIEDLEVHGILRSSKGLGPDDKGRVELTPWMEQEMGLIFKEQIEQEGQLRKMEKRNEVSVDSVVDGIRSVCPSLLRS